MSKIFGGSKSRSQQTASSSNVSYNQAYPFLQRNFGGTAANTYNSGVADINEELGGGFDGYRENIGFDFLEKLGLRKTAGNFSGRGAFQSGAALKGLANYQEGIGKASYNDFLEMLFKRAGLGLGGAGVLAGAGNFSQGSSTSQGTSSGSSSPGLGGFIGSIIGSAAASDERLKKNVVKLGEYEDGLGIYKYDYIDGRGPFVGVMAQEVAKLRPEALGPEVGGYLTVQYDQIEDPKEYI